jgi:hypothetical protein
MKDARNLCWKCHQERCDCYKAKTTDGITYPAEVALEWKRQADIAGANVEAMRKSIYALEGLVIETQAKLEQALSCDWKGVERDRFTVLLEREQAECHRLREALKEIVDPVGYMLKRVPPGHVFDGVWACRLAGMPQHLQQIADRALRGEE